jgi:hypothetical protein
MSTREDALKALSDLELRVLRAAGGQVVAGLDYGPEQSLATERLCHRGLIRFTYDDDQPTYYTTPQGDDVLSSLAKAAAPAASPVPRKREDAMEPCPFCGGAVKMAHMDIVCTGCSLVAKFGICSVTSHATRLWNTRAALPLPPAPAEPRGCPTPGGVGREEIVAKFIDAIEKLAFSMRAPNAYTPQLVMLCIEARRGLASSPPSDGEGVKEATP